MRDEYALNELTKEDHMDRLLDLVDRLGDYPQDWVITLCDGSGISEEPNTAKALVDEATFEYETIADMDEEEFQAFKFGINVKLSVLKTY